MADGYLPEDEEDWARGGTFLVSFLPATLGVSPHRSWVDGGGAARAVPNAPGGRRANNGRSLVAPSGSGTPRAETASAPPFSLPGFASGAQSQFPDMDMMMEGDPGVAMAPPRHERGASSDLTGVSTTSAAANARSLAPPISAMQMMADGRAQPSGRGAQAGGRAVLPAPPGALGAEYVAPAKAEPGLKVEDDEEELSPDDEALSQPKWGQGLSAAPPAPADDKAQANRDRNREHARNTRLRKKAYVEHLKQAVQELSEERMQAESTRQVALLNDQERQNVRQQVLQTMFYYRATGQTDAAKWRTLLDERFALTQPVAPYRAFYGAEVVKNQRVVIGVEGMIADTKSLWTLLQSIGQPHRRGENKVVARYYSGHNDMITEGDLLMTTWLWKTENAVACGARCEVFKQGMLQASFTPQNKIIALDFVFDVMAFMQQLQRARGVETFDVIPNTEEAAKHEAHEARVITQADAPHAILHVNAAWTELCGYTFDECRGRSLAILQGPKTDRTTVSELMHDVAHRRASHMVVTNYNKRGEPFQNYLRVFPLSSGGRVTSYLGECRAPRASLARRAPTPSARASAPLTLRLAPLRPEPQASWRKWTAGQSTTTTTRRFRSIHDDYLKSSAVRICNP